MTIIFLKTFFDLQKYGNYKIIYECNKNFSAEKKLPVIDKSVRLQQKKMLLMTLFIDKMCNGNAN